MNRLSIVIVAVTILSAAPALSQGANQGQPCPDTATRTSNQVATLDEAKAEFEASWKQWKAWAGLEEVTE